MKDKAIALAKHPLVNWVNPDTSKQLSSDLEKLCEKYGDETFSRLFCQLKFGMHHFVMDAKLYLLGQIYFAGFEIYKRRYHDSCIPSFSMKSHWFLMKSVKCKNFLAIKTYSDQLMKSDKIEDRKKAINMVSSIKDIYGSVAYHLLAKLYFASFERSKMKKFLDDAYINSNIAYEIYSATTAGRSSSLDSTSIASVATFFGHIRCHQKILKIPPEEIKSLDAIWQDEVKRILKKPDKSPDPSDLKSTFSSTPTPS